MGHFKWASNRNFVGSFCDLILSLPIPSGEVA